MSSFPRVRQIAPLTQLKKSLLPLPVFRREKKPVSQTAKNDWQDAVQTPNESLREAFEFLRYLTVISRALVIPKKIKISKSHKERGYSPRG